MAAALKGQSVRGLVFSGHVAHVCGQARAELVDVGATNKRCPFSSSSTGNFPVRPHIRIVSAERDTPKRSRNRLTTHVVVRRKSSVLIVASRNHDE